MQDLLKTLWNEPRAPDAPQRVWRDWLLVAVLIPLVVYEGLLSNDLELRLWLTMVAMVFVLSLLWRRTQPLLMVVLAFGTTATVQVLAAYHGISWNDLDTNACLLLLPYALLRWASGRELLLGLAVIAASFAISMVLGGHSWGEVLGASLFLLFPAALGSAVRYQDSAQRRATEQVRLRERERLARELHDTVAHHVSAIAVQAQAGRALKDSHPEAPREALEVIEEAASRTLADMRRIVGALRDEDGDAERSPNATLADLQRLARDGATPVPVEVVLTGALAGLDSALQSTLYRLAQEAVTNAVRHARNPSRIAVQVEGRAGDVRLRVIDDGEVVAAAPTQGYGLKGMSERVALLGGTLQAGPGPSGGWVVEAILPRHAPGS